MTGPFTSEVLASFDTTKYIKMRSGDHRFNFVWAVVVERRVIVRSWNDKPRGWYRAFLQEPRGDVQFDGRELPVQARRLRSGRLNDDADEAYAAKYTTKANVRYVRGFRALKRKATTLELLPR